MFILKVMNDKGEKRNCKSIDTDFRESTISTLQLLTLSKSQVVCPKTNGIFLNYRNANFLPKII